MDSAVAALADAHGVATSYADGNRRLVRVDQDVVLEVLSRLGVRTGNGAEIREELDAVRSRADEELPPTVVLRQGQTREIGEPAMLHTEDGDTIAIHNGLPYLPADLPLGWHRLVTDRQEVTLIIAPPRLRRPPATWGWAVQLYALHSPRSWGMGDFADLSAFAAGAGSSLRADAVLVNPLHAITPTHPVEPSPYSPSSRRFINPLYLRVADTDAYQRADTALREQVDALALAEPAPDAVLDYDAVWTAKRAALRLLADPAELGAIDVRADASAREFATFCTLAERHGACWQDWPEPLRSPDSPAVAAARTELHTQVRFHLWLQRLCRAQLAAGQHAATGAGMRIGLLSDLAVGIDPGGADAWALQGVLAGDVTIGAPPDAFNQRGQNWSLAPWHPRRLAEAGYRPFREMLRAQLGGTGGLRIDHVAGLWRLWWIPEGHGPTQGTYVRYDAEALLGVLALEAWRANAIVIGEDLGTVEERVSTALREQNMLGCAVAWFQRAEPAGEEGEPPLLPPRQWPEQAVATISTHDLPTTAGFLTGEHVRVRAELGQLGDDERTEWERAGAERAELLDLLRAEGLLVGEEPTDEQITEAMHGLLARTPCRLLLASPYDVLGESRQPNLPGTIDEYPNWRIPLPSDVDGLLADPRTRRMTEPLRLARPRPADIEDRQDPPPATPVS